MSILPIKLTPKTSIIGLSLVSSPAAWAIEIQTSNLAFIGLVVIFTLLSLLTLRELLRYKRAAKLLHTIEAERNTERMKSKPLMSATTDEIRENEIQEMHRIKMASQNEPSTLEELFEESAKTSMLSPSSIEPITPHSKPTVTHNSEPAITHSLEPRPKNYQGLDTSNTISGLSERSFIRGYGALAKPLERYFKTKNIIHLLKESPDQIQWLNIVHNLRNRQINDTVLNIIEIAGVDTQDTEMTQFSAHELFDDIIIGVELLFPTVEFELLGDTESMIFANFDETRKVVLALTLYTALAHSEQLIRQPVKINVQRSGDMVSIAFRDFAKGMTPQRLRETIASKDQYDARSSNWNNSLNILNSFIMKNGVQSVALGTNPAKGTKVTLFLKSA